MIDWTWITRNICLIIYYDYVNKKVIHFWFYDAERYEYIKEDLKVLRDEYKYRLNCKKCVAEMIKFSHIREIKLV